MIREDAPTNAVGTGAETALPPSHEPPGVTALGKKRAKKRRRYTFTQADMLRREGCGCDDPKYLPFLVSYNGAEQYVLYSSSEAQLKIELRKMYRPSEHKKLDVKRLYPNEVIKFYWNKRQQALGQ